MKKVIVSMMMAVALIAGGTAYAQTKTDGNTGATAQKECCKKDKDGKKCDKAGKGKKGGKGDRKKFNPFDGVQLTSDQQQRLQVLQQGLGPVELTPEMKSKIKENQNLTSEQKAQLKEEKKAQKLEKKKKYLNGVKEILTPEQYVVFLENVYLYSPQGQGHEKGMKAGKAGMKHDKKAHKSGKGGKDIKDKTGKK